MKLDPWQRYTPPPIIKKCFIGLRSRASLDRCSQSSPRRYTHAYGICAHFYCISLKNIYIFFGGGITLPGVWFKGTLPLDLGNSKIVYLWSRVCCLILRLEYTSFPHLLRKGFQMTHHTNIGSYFLVAKVRSFEWKDNLRSGIGQTWKLEKTITRYITRLFPFQQTVYLINYIIKIYSYFMFRCWTKYRKSKRNSAEGKTEIR